MRSNCLFWAVALYWRRRRKGKDGHLMIRPSRWMAWAPHLLYAEPRPSGTWRVVSYVPIKPARGLCPPPVFKGRSRWGDL